MSFDRHFGHGGRSCWLSPVAVIAVNERGRFRGIFSLAIIGSVSSVSVCDASRRGAKCDRWRSEQVRSVGLPTSPAADYAKWPASTTVSIDGREPPTHAAHRSRRAGPARVLGHAMPAKTERLGMGATTRGPLRHDCRAHSRRRATSSMDFDGMGSTAQPWPLYGPHERDPRRESPLGSGSTLHRLATSARSR